MAIVTKTTIQSNAHKNILSIISNKSNVSDPRNLNSNSTRKLVYDVDPFLKESGFDDLPFIVVERPRNSKSNISLDNTKKNINWTQIITVRTAYRGVNDQDGQGISDMHSLCDDLESTFNSKAIQQDLRELNMQKLELEQIDQDDGIQFQGKSVLETTFQLTYRTRMTVYTSLPPVANAGIDLTDVAGSTFSPDFSSSTGDILTYSYRLIGPAFDTTYTTVNPSFILDQSGDYTGTLTVTDNFGTTSTDTNTITVTAIGPP